MAGNQILGLLRKVFRRDRIGGEDSPRYRQPKYSTVYGTNIGYGPLKNQGSAYTGLDPSQTLEEDLLSRFADYEDMDEQAELSSALDIVSDDATQTDPQSNQIVHIDAKDEKIADMLNTCFHKNLKIDGNIWEICRTMCKYGNDYEEHIVTETEGLVNISFLSPPQMRRIDDEDGSLLGFIYDRTGMFNLTTEEFQRRIVDRDYNAKTYYENHRNVNVFEDWEVSHFRLRSKFRGSQYGWSFLEAARWTNKRLQMLEDAALLYKISRAPQRYVFNVDVGDLPPNEALKYVNQVKQQLKKSTIVDKKTGKLDLASNMWCLSLDTKIPLLNGQEKTISELIADKEQGIQNWVYSFDIEKNKCVPGKVLDAKVTRRNAEIIKVTLDNGQTITCTPDHKFLLRDGSYIQACDLLKGASLMPLYKWTRGKHEVIRNASARQIISTHKMVVDGLGIKCDSKTSQIHHSDGNGFNNYPDNLEVISIEEHNQKHHEVRSRNMFRITQRPEQGEKVAHYNRLYNKKRFLMAYNQSDKHKEDNVIRAKNLKSLFEDRHEEMCEAMKIKFPAELKDFLMDVVRSNPDLSTDRLCDVIMGNDEMFEMFKAKNTREIKNIHRHLLLKALRDFGFSSFKDFKDKASNNHKVVSVEKLIHREDTGCIEVEQWNNFALQAGVFVHNSNTDDFFIPVRKDKPSMAVETVGGFDSAFYMEDLDYFKNKLYAAIKIPKDFLNFSEDSVSKANLSTQDIRFSRSILRIQRELRTGLMNMARVHLSSLGHDPDSVEFDIYLTSPSSIFETSQMEVKQVQLEIAEKYRAFVDDFWIMTNILHFSEEEVDDIQKRLQKQKAAENPFSENRFPTVESKQMNPEVRKMMNDIGAEALLRDKQIGSRLVELKSLAEEMKYILRKK